MPPDDNFIIKDRTIEELAEEGINYLSLEGMLSTFEKLGMSRDNLCTYCIGGEHPFK